VLSQSQEIVASHVESEPLAYRAVRGGLWVALSSYWTIGFGFIEHCVDPAFGPGSLWDLRLAMFFFSLINLRP